MTSLNSKLSASLSLLLTITLFACSVSDEPAAPEAAATSAEAPTAEAAAPAVGDLQAVSLLGEDLYARVDTEGVIAEADAALAAAPDDVELLIAAGRVRRNFWQYRGAIELYTRAIARAPNDWRAYRFRGHRHISVREFDLAVPDLERARALAPYNWDVAYHLGLAYFVSGRFDDAANEYVRCLALSDNPAAAAAQSDNFRSCSQNGDDPESMVAMTEWAVRALLRADRKEDADRLIDGVAPDLAIETNVAYYNDLLFYKGLMSADELLDLDEDSPYRLETVGFGIANWMLVNGQPESAIEIFEEIVADPWWPGFGRIAAEAELARIGSGA
jgi:tetratricopeptide (TPR) repeat protein